MIDILQITPAIGWVAVYKNDDGSFFDERVAVWALKQIETDGIRTIHGFGPDLSIESDDIVNFVRYEYRGDKPLRRRWLEDENGQKSEIVLDD